MAEHPFLEEEVRKKEELIEKAFGYLSSIYKQLETIQKPGERIRICRKDWASLQGKKHSLRIFVGVAGDTGHGKTSLLNALVDAKKEILPQGNSGACTGTVCIYKFNHEDDPAKLYRAEIAFRPLEAIENDLKQLFDELDDLAANQNESLGQEMQTQLLKQAAVWESCLGFKYGDKNSPAQILHAFVDKQEVFQNYETNPQTKEIVWINAADPTKFAKELRRYIDSGVKKQPMWPLVESVDIYIKSDILQRGICLVDLPGETDALESRSRRALEYYNKLDKIMVVGDTIRAADSSTASKFLSSSSTDFLDLQIDGFADKRAMCVVFTKTDSLDWKSYFTAKEYDEEDDDLLSEVSEKYSELETIEENIQTLKEDLDACRQLEAKTGEGGGDPMDGASKRPYSDTTDPAGSDRKRMRENLSKMKKLQSQLSTAMRLRTTLTDRIVFLCTLHRNIATEERIREELKASNSWKQMARQASRVRRTAAAAKKGEKGKIANMTKFELENEREEEEAKSIAMLPVSTAAYNNLKKGEPMTGFKKEEDTGIPQLRQWIEDGSLEKRNAFAAEMLQECQRNFDYLRGWLLGDDELSDLKVASEYIEMIKEVIRGHKANFVTRIRLVKTIITIRTKHLSPFSKTKKDENFSMKDSFAALEKSLPATVKRWEHKIPNARGAKDKDTKIHFLTYQAILRREGVKYRSSRGIEYHWIGDLAHSFWKAFGANWSKIIAKKIPDFRASLKKHLQSTLNKTIAEILADPKLPAAYVEAVRRTVLRQTNKFGLLITKLDGKIANLQAKVRDARKKDEQFLLEEFAPAFAMARELKGKGSFAKQTETISKHANDIQRKLYVSLRDKLEEGLSDKLEETRLDMHAKLNYFVNQDLHLYLQKLAECVCRDPNDKSDKGPAKKHLSKEIQKVQKVLRPMMLGEVEEWMDMAKAILHVVTDHQNESDGLDGGDVSDDEMIIKAE